MFAGLFVANEAQAGQLVDIDDSSVFVKQQTSKTCTLCSAEMMVRRASILLGNTDWEDIEEWGFRSYAWEEGAGLRNNFWYNGIHVEHGWLSGGSSNWNTLISLLEEHPEGIVIYNTGRPHAVLLTDYTDGTFYIADPSNAVASGRIPISYASGGVSVTSVTQYWYVSSPWIDPSPYKIVFDFMGGEGGTTLAYFRYGIDVFFSDERGTKPITSVTVPYKKHYNFESYVGDGWSGGDYGERYVYSDGTFASDLCWDITNDLTLYATWSRVNPITLDIDSGEGLESRNIYFYKGYNEFYTDYECTRPISSIEVPSKLGYSFLHYYGDGTSGGDYGERYIYADGTFAGDLCWDITKDATLYPMWSKLTLESIELIKQPYRLSYTVENDLPDVSGGVLQLNYAEGDVQETELTSDMISGYNRHEVGEQQITVDYEGVKTQYTVSVSDCELGDVNLDGKVNANDAIFILMHAYFPDDPAYDIGLQFADFNRDGSADYKDAVQLLMHVCFPDEYEI